MAFPDILLDTSWSLQFVPGADLQIPTLKALMSSTEAHAASPTQLQSLAQECCKYLSSQRPVYQGELNDEREKTGQLRECAISQLWPHSWSADIQAADRRAVGLLVEARYQKTTYQTVLLGAPPGQGRVDACPVSLVLFKAAPSHVNHIVNWLDWKFNLPRPTQLRLPPELILHGCSRYLHNLSASWTSGTGHGDALRQATLRQVVGNLKFTITTANIAETDIAGMLRTMDFDVPSETVDGLLRKAQQRSPSAPSAYTAFLHELATTIHAKTGLRLPLSANPPSPPAATVAEPPSEPPLKVTRITCAAFATSVDGRLKFAKKPIENAEVIGYDKTMVRAANWELLESIRVEAWKRSSGHGEDG